MSDTVNPSVNPQASSIVWRMEQAKRKLQNSKEDLRQTQQKLDKAKADVQMYAAILTRLQDDVLNNDRELANAVAAYTAAGTNWLKIEAVPVEE